LVWLEGSLFPHKFLAGSPIVDLNCNVPVFITFAILPGSIEEFTMFTPAV